jgi:hypothetical protein
MMVGADWLSIRIKNDFTGEEITVYHPPGNGEEIDRKLRYGVLGLASPEYSPVKIIVRREREA